MKQAHFEFTKNLQPRHRTGRIWLFIFRASTVVGILALIALLFNVIAGAFGHAALEYRVDPKSLAVDGVSFWRIKQRSSSSESCSRRS